MIRKLIKNFMAGIMLAGFFCSNNVVNAYDLPKIKTEKSIENKDIPNKNENIIDKNYILIGSYKGFNYYLDRYSVKIKKNKTDKQIWSQFIFPIGSNVTAKNSRSILQKFYYNGKNCYNSTRASNNINDIKDEEAKKFLWKCFKIGYYHAFNKYLNIDILNEEQFNDKYDNTAK